jgi:N-carbamoyl-L-amino-acid hydrolase
MIRIDRRRLLADMRKLAEFGKVGTGVNRPAFSAADMAAREWLGDRMTDAGLDAQIDGVGNVFGRSRGPGPAILIGSHSDSVPRGGWLDGAMGVIYGLEIARAASEASGGPSIDVIAFEEEEGAYLPLLGSLSFCGDLKDGDIDAARNTSGELLSEAIAEAGLANRPAARFEDGRYRAYLEAHIEQGPRLEAENLKIGVVTAIVGIRRFRVAFGGRADHAGTTPMAMRHDAGRVAIRVAGEMIDRFERDAGPDTVWNIGKMTFAPGAANVVPSTAEFLFEFRDTDAAFMEILEGRLQEIVQRANGAEPVAVSLEKTAEIPPTPMDPALGEIIEAAGRDAGAASMRMPSGGGHDAMVLARHMPTAMLFVPSIGGRSHDIEEDTDEDDIVLGCEVLADVVNRLLP